MKEEEEEEEEEELCTVIGVAFCSGSVHKDAQITVHNSNIYIYIYIYITLWNLQQFCYIQEMKALRILFVQLCAP